MARWKLEPVAHYLNVEGRRSGIHVENDRQDWSAEAV